MAKKTQKRLPRRREEFTYRGFRLDDLRAMGMSELVPLMPSRARRKVNRGLTRGEVGQREIAHVIEGDHWHESTVVRTAGNPRSRSTSEPPPRERGLCRLPT